MAKIYVRVVRRKANLEEPDEENPVSPGPVYPNWLFFVQVKKLTFLRIARRHMQNFY